MKFLRRLAFLVLFYSGFNSLCGRFAGRRVYVIGYHSIGDESSSHREESYPHLTIPRAMFERQIAYLAAHGHTFVPMHRIFEADIRHVRKPTALYFDDGFKNIRDVALPILQRYQAPATLFLTTGIPDGEVETFGRIEGAESSAGQSRSAFLSWDDVRVLARAGWDIGAHGRMHKKLTSCTPSELSDELVTPRERIAKEVGTPTALLSHPHGRFNAPTLAAVQSAGYTGAVSTIEGWNTSDSIGRTPLLVKKIAPKPADTMSMFEVKVYSWNLFAGIEARMRNKLGR